MYLFSFRYWPRPKHGQYANHAMLMTVLHVQACSYPCLGVGFSLPISSTSCLNACRRILPAVQQVSLACRGVAICPSFFSGALPSLNLTFCKASPNTMKLLRSHMELSSAACPDLLREVWKATLLGKDAGVLDFDSGIFDAYCDSEAEY